MRGAVLFNGNPPRPSTRWCRTAAPLLLSSRHGDPEVARSRRVVLVTAAWGDGEHDEGHVKRSLNGIGLPSHYEDGYDTNLVNLSLLHEVRGLARTARGSWPRGTRSAGSPRWRGPSTSSTTLT